jgi:uncharacterized protein (TIGR02284 family)
LIATCRDGEHGFRYAANHVRDSTVKGLFLEIASQREQFAADILSHAQRLGGANRVRGESYRRFCTEAWMTLKDAVGGHDDAAIIREAERGERSALAAYEEALDGMLPPAARGGESNGSVGRGAAQPINRVHALLVSAPDALGIRRSPTR